MKFINKEIGLSIEICDEVLKNITGVGLNHFPNEFGGLLIGVYSDDKQMVCISDTILPLAYKSSKISFERGTEGLEEMLLGYFEEIPSKIYVGEWHTHPNAAPIPSGTDIRALQEIVKSENVNINSPIMLIVGLTEAHIEFGFYVYLNKKIYKYEPVVGVSIKTN